MTAQATTCPPAVLKKVLYWLMEVPERVRMLGDGTKVVVASKIEEFLDWACRKFEISVCSVGYLLLLIAGLKCMWIK